MINDNIQENKESLEDKILSEIADELIAENASFLVSIQDSEEYPRKNCLTAFTLAFNKFRYNLGTINFHYIPYGKSLVIVEGQSREPSGEPKITCLKYNK